MKLILIVAAAVTAGIGIAGFICYRTLALPNMKPLSKENLSLCRSIVGRGEGYPWVCRHALKTGMCACQPCEKVLRERDATA